MSGERGQALVELALVLPVLLILALAIGELSELGVARLALTHAAAEGARTAALTNDDRLARASIAAASAPSRSAPSRSPSIHRRSNAAVTRAARSCLSGFGSAISTPLSFIGLPALVVRGEAARSMEWTP